MPSKPSRGRRPDLFFLFAVTVLVCVGILMVFSSSMVESLKAGDALYYMKRQLVFVLAGFALMFAGYKIDYHIYRRYSPWMLSAAFVMLIAVFLPFLGRSAGGAARWIDIGIAFQPSEIVKFCLIVYLASIFAGKPDGIRNFKLDILGPMAVVIAACALLIKQPDMGTALVILATFLAMIFIAGARLRHIGAMIAACGVGVAAASIISPYRFRRLLAFTNPWADPKGIGYHIIQSLIAVGSGGIFGLGIGMSRQKYMYLPEQYTDFIFAILCEELGLIGAVFVIGLFLGLIGRGLKIAREAADPFGRLLCAGLVSYIAIQAVLNIFVVIGLSPTTGIPLPFISYGGTSLLVLMFSSGVILNVGMNKSREQ